MLIDRDKVEAKLHMSDEERAVYWLRRTVRELDILEEEIGVARDNPDICLVDRLARVGGSKLACDQLESLLNAVEDLKQGRPLPSDVRRLLTECEAAERSADSQLAAIVERVHSRPE
jgi:hypothetical protein